MPDNKPTELAKNFKEIIAEKIRAMFVDLIPETEWSDMVEREIRAFFSEDLTLYVDTGHGVTRTHARLPAKGNTRFRQLVWERLNELVDARLKEEANDVVLREFLDRHLYNYNGRGTKTILPKLFQEIVEGAGGANIVAFMLTPFVQDIVSRIQQR